MPLDRHPSATIFQHCAFMTVLLLLAWALSSGKAAANLLGGDDPLSPQEAFVPSLVSVSDSSIVLRFNIADGYYLYRDKTEFDVVDPVPKGSTVSLGAPGFSEAIITEDDFFGEQAVFRQNATITIPYDSDEALNSLSLSVKFQGCADIGLCYPPTTTPVQVDFGSETTSIPDVVGKNTVSDLLGTTPGSNELLPPELAFQPQLVSTSTTEIQLQWLIEPGYYLYRDKLSFAVHGAGDSTISAVSLGRGSDQFDEFFGNVEVFREFAQARLSLNPGAMPGSEASLQINYQGCADIGVCYPPSIATLPLVFNTDSAAAGIAVQSGAEQTAQSLKTAQPAQTQAGTQTSQAAQSEQDRLSSLLGSNSLWLNVATFFGLGLLLAFTPCVLPMVPILSSLIVGQGASMSTARAFRLSLVYVLVMASTYAAVGVVVGLSGYNVQAFLQNPWVLSGIALLFVILSLSMFGFYELQMPRGIQARLTQWSNKQGGGQYSGVIAMGFISTLIVGPCVTAPLAGALIYIAKTGDALIGGAALFALGLGMGAPLLLIGTSAGKLLPRAGAWMNATKAIFGLLMLIMAVYLISRFLPLPVTMALYGILALMTGVYAGATDTLNRESSGWQRFGKGSGLIVAVYGLALLTGALAGGTSYTAPLRGVFTGSSGAAVAENHGLVFTSLKSLDDLQAVVKQASLAGKPVMLDFYADWCISCKEMEAYTFTDSKVQAQLANAVLVQADVTANDEIDQALLKHFDLFGPPGIIFFDTSGEEIPASRLVGFLNAEKFDAHLERFLAGSGR